MLSQSDYEKIRRLEQQLNLLLRS